MKDTILHPKNRFTWVALAFQGGFLNVAGLLTVHIFVSHVTGFSAHFTMNLLDGDLIKSLYFLLVPLFFLIGAFFSCLFTELRKKNNKQPGYINILCCLSTIFFLVTILGINNFFGEFGEAFSSFRDFILLSILAFACGSQNAIFTHFSKSIIRTTHLTGITTDLGIGLAKFFISGNQEERLVNKIRIDIILSFTVGSLLGAYILPRIQFLGFLIPAIISLIVAFRLFTTKIPLRSN
jgi:uncharacterized membrane protein YoaK (UPF0700 family)